MAIDGLGPGRETAQLDPGRVSPTVLRMVLGTQLRRLRETAGVSTQAASDAIRASHAKISRLELGRVGFKERDVLDLLKLYGVTDEREQEGFLRLVRQANAPGWWQQYGDVLPNWFEMYIRLEQAATTTRTYQMQFIPGLFQTEDYARAVMMQEHRTEPADEIERRVDLRMARQKLLTEPGVPRYWAVLDEAVLRRPCGSAQVMRDQLRHLVGLSRLRGVTLQVLPFSSGYSGTAGSFTILRFAEPDLPDVAYLEQLTSAIYLDKRPEVEQYLAVMERICVRAETPVASAALIEAIAAET